MKQGTTGICPLHNFQVELPKSTDFLKAKLDDPDISAKIKQVKAKLQIKFAEGLKTMSHSKALRKGKPCQIDRCEFNQLRGRT